MTLEELLAKELDDKIELLKESVATGPVPDWATYQTLRGEIKGLLTAKRYVEDLVRNQRNSDE